MLTLWPTCVSKYFSRDVKSDHLFVLGTFFQDFVPAVRLWSYKMQFIQDVVNLFLSEVTCMGKCVYIYASKQLIQKKKRVLQAIKKQ